MIYLLYGSADMFSHEEKYLRSAGTEGSLDDVWNYLLNNYNYRASLTLYKFNNVDKTIAVMRTQQKELKKKTIINSKEKPTVKTFTWTEQDLLGSVPTPEAEGAIYD
jgi:hypothetical protein